MVTLSLRNEAQSSTTPVIGRCFFALVAGVGAGPELVAGAAAFFAVVADPGAGPEPVAGAADLSTARLLPRDFFPEHGQAKTRHDAPWICAKMALQRDYLLATRWEYYCNAGSKAAVSYRRIKTLYVAVNVA
jgi:hypothetical protein